MRQGRVSQGEQEEGRLQRVVGKLGNGMDPRICFCFFLAGGGGGFGWLAFEVSTNSDEGGSMTRELAFWKGLGGALRHPDVCDRRPFGIFW